MDWIHIPHYMNQQWAPVSTVIPLTAIKCRESLNQMRNWEGDYMMNDQEVRIWKEAVLGPLFG
jgi:hypothetical protein